MGTIITIDSITTDIELGPVKNAIRVNEAQFVLDTAAPVQTFFISRDVDKVSAHIFALARERTAKTVSVYTVDEGDMVLALTMSAGQIIGWTETQNKDGAFESFSVTGASVALGGLKLKS